MYQKWTKVLNIVCFMTIITAISYAVDPPQVTYLYQFNSQLYSQGKIAMDTAGFTYVTDPIQKKISVITPTGSLYSAIDFDGVPISIAVDLDGNLYVGDETHQSVAVFNKNWEFQFNLGVGDENDKLVILPNDLVYDSGSNRIYVVDSKQNLVKVYSTDGALLFSFGSYGTQTGQFSYPTGIAIDTSINRIFIADHNNARINIFDMDGNYISRFGRYGGDPGRFTRPQGIAVDTAGRIYVTDSYLNTVQVLDYAGISLGYIGEYGDDTAQFRTPIDVMTDQFNRLIVSSAGKTKLEIFGLDVYQDPVPVELSYFKAE